MTKENKEGLLKKYDLSINEVDNYLNMLNEEGKNHLLREVLIYGNAETVFNLIKEFSKLYKL